MIPGPRGEPARVEGSAAGRVLVFEDAAALAAAAALGVVEAVAARVAEIGRASLGLSGGRTPVPTYRRLAAEPLRSGVDWARVRIYFADERAVPPDDPESNFRLARETLLDPLRLPPRNVHRMKGEYPDLEAAVEEYEAHLTEPIDVLILGVGEDGHVASLFPGTPLVGERVRRVATVSDSPKPPARRLTLTARALSEARRVLVLATGAEKAGAVARALEGESDARALPAQLVRGRDWYLDRAAAGKLVAIR